jgi:galactose mutarotase-like enzyme
MIEFIENDLLRVEVNAFGAELKSIFNKENQQEYLWQAHPAFWTRRAPVLFPIVGKLKNNIYKSEGKCWEMSQHGFARDSIFQLMEKTSDSLTYCLKHSPESLKVYPYRFEFYIQYLLTDNNLTVKYEVVNIDDKTIHFSVGGHPGFNCPLNKGEQFSDYYLEFEKEETTERYKITEGCFNGDSEKLLRKEKMLPLSEDLFLADAIVLKNLNSSFIKLKSRKSNYELKFNFRGFPYLGIWTKPGAPFLCIEPWYGLADRIDFEGDFEEKEGMNSLFEGDRFVCAYSVEIK